MENRKAKYLKAAKLEFKEFNGGQKVIPIKNMKDYKPFPELKKVTGNCSIMDTLTEFQNMRVFGYLLAYNITN